MIAQDIHIAKTLTFYAITFLSLVDCFKLINFIYWIKKKGSTLSVKENRIKGGIQ